MKICCNASELIYRGCYLRFLSTFDVKDFVSTKLIKMISFENQSQNVHAMVGPPLSQIDMDITNLRELVSDTMLNSDLS